MPVNHVHIQRAQLVGAVRAVGGGHRIGHEGRAVGREPEGEPDHRILHVEAVVDEFDGDARVFHCGGNGPGFAVMQAVHRVEHVGHDARARVEAGFGGLVVGVAVAHGRHHARRGELADGADAVRQFGRDGDLTDTPRLAA